MIFKKYYPLSLITILCLCICVHNQNKSSTLTVIVKDQLRQSIPSAQITLLNSDKQQKQSNTDKQGIVNFTKLLNGEFSIIVTAKGFKEFINESILIGSGEVKTLEISLEIAPIESSVDVDPNQTVDKENYGSRTVITEEEIKNLPDDPEQFERAIRAILGQSITGEELGITVNGIPKINLPPKEAIQQIKVDQNIFSAKNSSVGGEGIQVTTKAGMTKFEGNFAFGFADSRLDASNPFLGRKVPYQNKAYKFNLTGPLTKRSSFILSLNRNQRDTDVAINATVLNNNLQIENFKQTFPLPRLSHNIDFSINYDPTDKQKLYLNYIYQTSQGNGGVGGFSLPESLTSNKNQSHSFSLSHQYFPNAKLTSKSILSFDYSKGSFFASSSAPSLIVSDAFSSGSSLNDGSNTSYKMRFSNDIEQQFGKNNFQYGFEVNVEKRILISKENFNGAYIFTGKTAPLLDENNNLLLDDTGNIITGLISSIESYRRNVLFRKLGLSSLQIRQLGGAPDQFTISNGNPQISISQIDYAVYLQDNYKINESLGVGAGVRYENQTNIKSNFNISPRLSLIWSPNVKEKKPIWSLPKISAGAGVYFSKFGIENIINEKQLNSNERFSYFVSNSPTLDFFPNIPPIELLENSNQARSLTFIDPNIQNPLQSTFNIGISKSLTKEFSLNFSYTRSNNYRTSLTRNINSPLAGTYDFSIPDSGIYPSGSSGYIYKISSIGKSVSDRITITPKLPRFKILKYGGYFNTNYSFNKSKSNITNGSSSPFDPYDFSNEYSPTLTSGIHSLNVLYFQSLPFDSRLSLSWSVRSGARFNIITGRDTNGDGYYLERPAFASDPNKPGVIATKYGLLDPTPSLGDTIIPRNIARGPLVTDTGLSFNKVFGFNKNSKTKKAKQEFSINVSITNLFNINNKGVPIGNMSSPNFLKFLNNSSVLNGGFYSTPRSFNFNLNFSF